MLRRGKNLGWNSGTGGILTVSAANGLNNNIITEYGCVSEALITISVTAYIGT